MDPLTSRSQWGLFNRTQLKLSDCLFSKIRKKQQQCHFRPLIEGGACGCLSILLLVIFVKAEFLKSVNVSRRGKPQFVVSYSFIALHCVFLPFRRNPTQYKPSHVQSDQWVGCFSIVLGVLLSLVIYILLYMSPNRLICLNTQSSGSWIIWEGLGGVAFGNRYGLIGGGILLEEWV